MLMDQDGYKFIIDREWAMLSGTIRTMLSTDDGGTYACYFNNVRVF